MAKKKSARAASAAPASAPVAIGPVDRRQYLFVGLVLATALILRIIALVNFNESLYGDFLLWDERLYQAWATNIIQGKPFVASDISPLPAYVMAIVYRILSPDPFYIRCLNVIFGVLACWLVYLTGRALKDPLTGLLAGLVAALYKPFIFFSVTILKESLGLFLFSATVYLLIAVFQERLPWRLWAKIALLGVAAGFLINVRQNCFALLPLPPLVILWKTWRDRTTMKGALVTVALFGLGLALAVSPFAIRNYRTAGAFAATPAGGFNLYLGNNLHNPYPYYRPVPFVTSVPTEQAVQFIIEASRREGRKLTAAEASDHWTKEVIRIALDRPVAFAGKIFDKTLALFNQFEEADNHHIGFTSRFVPFFRLPFPEFWLVFPLGMAGLLMSLPRSREAKIIGMVFLIYALTVIVFFSNMRIRIPLLIVLIPYAVIGLRHLQSRMKDGGFRGAAPYVSAVALFAIIECIPLAGTGDMTALYNTHAINLDGKGFEQEAIRYWQASSAMNRPYSAYANLSLAGKFYRRGDIGTGDHYLKKIPDNSFAASSKYELMGDVLTARRLADQATLAYRKSLDINSGQRTPRFKLIQLLKDRDPAAAAREEAQLHYISSFYSR
jgi:4-amino-4-deoxy-L-arabinose transferase-like glycosyltransferase